MLSGDKIYDVDSIKSIVKSLYTENKKIVFTNGCFDILHYGHISLLEEAASFGDILIVGINSDGSVKRLKGKNRPLQDIQSRSRVLAAIGCVDLVVIFEDDTPIELIKLITPQVLVKGGDYSIDEIVGADHVVAHDGEVKIVPIEAGYSTSNIERRMKGE